MFAGDIKHKTGKDSDHVGQQNLDSGLDRAGTMVKPNRMKLNRINLTLESKKFQFHDLRVVGGGVWLSSS